MHVRLTTQVGGAKLRTPVVVGTTEALPAVGEQFFLVGDALDPEYTFRLVNTSPVTYVGTDGLFTTESGSCYRCEVLPDG